MKLFNASKLISEESIAALIQVEGNPVLLEEMTAMIKCKLLESYQFHAYNVPKDFATNSYVIATNHLTDSDAPLIMSLHDQIMKKETDDFEKLFVFAKENCFNGVSIPKELVPMLKHENVVGVDRNSIGGSMIALRTAINWYQSNEKPKHYLIFAQGTIYDINKEQVEDIEKGAFWLARKIGIPVLPAFIEQAVEGEENRIMFGAPICIPEKEHNLDSYKEKWVKSVIDAQNALETVTGKPARKTVLDAEHQVRKRPSHEK